MKKLFVLTNIFNYDEYFDFLAEKLLNNFVISANGQIYNFIEIEFYYYSKRHPDTKTLKRISKPGKFFFHQYGMDISFLSDEKEFGGVLIRSIKKENEFINGPHKVLNELLNNINDSNEISLKLIKNINDFPYKKMKRIIRNTPEYIYYDKFYRYVALYSDKHNKYKKI